MILFVSFVQKCCGYDLVKQEPRFVLGCFHGLGSEVTHDIYIITLQ